MLHAKRVWQPSTWTEIASPRGLLLLLVEDDLFGCQNREVHVFVNPTLVATIDNSLVLESHDNHLLTTDAIHPADPTSYCAALPHHFSCRQTDNQPEKSLSSLHIDRAGFPACHSGSEKDA
jgi:hypothetical protein